MIIDVSLERKLIIRELFVFLSDSHSVKKKFNNYLFL